MANSIGREPVKAVFLVVHVLADFNGSTGTRDDGSLPPTGARPPKPDFLVLHVEYLRHLIGLGGFVGRAVCALGAYFAGENAVRRQFDVAIWHAALAKTDSNGAGVELVDVAFAPATRGKEYPDRVRTLYGCLQHSSLSSCRGASRVELPPLFDCDAPTTGVRFLSSRMAPRRESGPCGQVAHLGH